MNNKIISDCIKQSWLFYTEDMCQTTFSIGSMSAVLSMLSHLMDEQAAHEETKALLKERMAHQEGLELRLGQSERARSEAVDYLAQADSQVNRLQSEIANRQTYIEELESRIVRLENNNQQQAKLFSAAIAKRDAAIDYLRGGIAP